MMNKQGFTLAEVLISLAIIGSIAALIIPALYKNSKTTMISSSLANSVEQLQNGIKNIFLETNNYTDIGNIETLSAIKKSDIGLEGLDYITDDNTFYDSTKGLLGIENTNYSISNIRDYNNNALSQDLINNFTAYKFKKTPAVVMFQNVSIDKIATANSDDIIAKVIIDANGSEKPNMFGKDIFLFGLTDGGVLIPAGTKKYQDFDKTVIENSCAGDDVGNGVACAARVMADKWEIKY